MKRFLIVAIIILAVSALGGFSYLGSLLGGDTQHPNQKTAGTLWNFKERSLEGEPVDLNLYHGKVALVVNVASKCGFTPQYRGLEDLYRKLKDKGFVILAFPCNDFLGQEPGSPDEIRKFCTLTYGVTFPMFEKVEVKGEHKSPIYRFLTAGGLQEPTWNFTKYLVGRDGKVIARFAPKTTPEDSTLLAAIDKALGK